MATPRFDANQFLQAEYVEALDTERTLFPQGECVGQKIEDFKIIEPKAFQDKDGNTKMGSPQLELKILIREDHATRIRSELGYPEDRPVYFNYRTFLEINEQTGWLEFGPNKNIALGQIRAALGQNEAGVPWSFAHLRGAGPLAFTVKHEEWESNGKKGTSERVSKWASAD